MAMVVRSNLMAYNANRQLGMNNSAVSKNLEKLSSGFKINRAADDAAGLAISEKMKAQIKGLETASSNSQDGISLVQTAEGALTEVHDMLNRMTELATKSANGTIKDEVDRDAIQNEVNKLNEEIDRISQSTNFNGINLLDGSLSTTGKASGPAASFKIDNLDSTLSDVDATKASFSASALISNMTKASGGERFSTTIALDNGKSYTVELTFDTEKKQFTSADGKVYGSTAATNAITLTEAGEALAAALKDTALGKDYKITGAAGTLAFEAKTAGATTPSITGITHSWADYDDTSMTEVANTVKGTAGKDAYQTVDVTKLTKFTGDNADKAVFSIGGKKFALVGNDATADLIAKLDEDVTFIKSTTDSATAGTAADVTNGLQIINQKTGMKLTVNATTTTMFDLVDSSAGSTKVGGGLTLQIGDTGEDFNQVTVSVDNMSSKGIGTKDLDVSTQEAAKASIETIKAAINQVSTNRSEMGALQNRLEHTINNLDVAAENMTNANSRIRDTDMAKQMMEYTKMNVLTQSAQAMLAQANQNPQSILQLLQ